MSKARFLHIADVHLGFRQYGADERQDDFGRAFDCALQNAGAFDADFVLLAGDLFHRHAVDPQTLYQAKELLQPLRAAGIPLIAIAGNHDSSHLADGMSWLDYLAATGEIILLEPRYEGHEIVLEPWNGDLHTGGYVDLACGVRVFGLRYYGASTHRMLVDYRVALEKLPHDRYTILMMHAGVQGQMPFDATALPEEELLALRDTVDYVALGHHHKPFEIDGFVHNPGSLETVSIDEAAWPERGNCYVEVDTDARTIQSRIMGDITRRPFQRVVVDAGECATYKELQEAIWKAAGAVCRPPAPVGIDKPVLTVVLTGLLRFPRALFNTDELSDRLWAITGALLVRIMDQTTAEERTIETREDQPRVEMERQILDELAHGDKRLEGRESTFSTLALHLKDGVLRGETAEAIVAELLDFGTTNPLEVAHVD
jgi:DNA repair exonuclease SbcCD nuclease subunit